MITIQGKGVSAGVGVGPLYFYRRATAEIKRYTVEDTDAEWHRFKGAQTGAIEQLGVLAEQARKEAGDEAAMLFETHQMMAGRPRLRGEPSRVSHRQPDRVNAEAAVTDTGQQQFAEMFACDGRQPTCRPAPPTSSDVSQRGLGRLLTGDRARAASRPMCRCCSWRQMTWPRPRPIQLDKAPRSWASSRRAAPVRTHTRPFWPARWAFPPSSVHGRRAASRSWRARAAIADGQHRRGWSSTPTTPTRDRLLKKQRRADSA